MTVKSTFVQKGDAIDHTPVSALDAGTIVNQGGLVGITKLDIPAATLGALAIVGVYSVPREQSTAFAVGAPVWWNSAATPEGGAATGAAVANDGGGKYPYLGRAIAAAADSATVLTVPVLLQDAGAPASPAVDGGAGTLIVIRKSFADAAGDTSVFGTDGAPRAMRIIDAFIENTAANGANANTVAVSKTAAGAAPVTDLMALNGKVDTDIVRATKIAAANASIAAGGALYLNAVKAGGTMGGTVTILAIAA